MRKAALLALLVACAAAPLRAAEELSVVLSGRYHDPVAAYKVGSTFYLSAKEAGELYGGQVYWYAVSGRVQMSFRGRPLQFVVNSDSARVGDQDVKMESSVLLRTSQAFVPLSFFLGEDFSSWSGMDSVFNPRTRLLTVDRRSSVGPVRWFSYSDYTRVSIELKKGLAYSATTRGVGGLSVTVPFGIIEGSEQTQIGDGLVDSYLLKQNQKAAVLSLRFARRGLKWRVKELAAPRRLVVDVFEREPKREVIEKPEPRAQASAPAAPLPEAAQTAEPETAPPAASAGPQIVGKTPGATKRRIVIDAGHGGKDAGATGRSGTLEKEINLQAAQELARLLKQEGTFEVLLTRADDTFVPLADRSRLANDFGADLFVSLHCNASPNKRDTGYEVYFLSEKASDPEAQRAAEAENSVLALEGKSPQDETAALLLQELSKTENINSASELAALMARDLGKRVTLPNRGVKQAAFYVLRGTHAPAILFEMGYISNRKDETKLESKQILRKVVDGVYAGILDYAKREGWLSPRGAD